MLDNVSDDKLKGARSTKRLQGEREQRKVAVGSERVDQGGLGWVLCALFLSALAAPYGL